MIKLITSARDIDSFISICKVQGMMKMKEPHKAKADTMYDFFSSIMARPDITNDTISLSWNQHQEDP